MPDDALFDDAPYEVSDGLPDDWSTMSPGRRLTWRQRHIIGDGLHPLSLALDGNLTLLPANDPITPYGGGVDSWWHKRCGNCRFRTLLYGYPKCTASPTRLSHGAATDVRGWWPACRDYQPVPTEDL